ALDRLVTGGGQVVAHSPPAGDGQLVQPRPAPGEQPFEYERPTGIVRRLLWGDRRTIGGLLRRRAGGGHLSGVSLPVQGLVQAGQEGVVGGAPQRGARRLQRRQIYTAAGRRRHFRGRLGDPVAQRGGRDRSRQRADRGGPLLAHPPETVGQGIVEAVGQLQRLGEAGREPADQLVQLHSQHQRTVPGNQCISGSGAVVTGSSR